MIGNLISWCVFGLVAGAVARLLTPGRDPMGCFATIAVGVVGSVIGGFLSHLIFGGGDDRFEPAGFLGAVIGGVLLLLILRRFGKPRDPVA
jgi:uncharacterized membrane protein YeaQ/YmgE (transglycosylase-associated protein family)